MKKFLINKFPSLYLFNQLFRFRLKAVDGDLQSIHDKFSLNNNSHRVAVDLGCGTKASNLFKVSKCFGIDLYENKKNKILKCRLGFEKIPFKNNSIDYLTAYDLLEHIPRYAELPNQNNSPFIFLMNECFRILKKGGIFLSMTPIYPYLGAFQDPTHNNIMTADTFRYYFSEDKISIAKHYGIKTNFKIKYQRMLGQHLVAVMVK